MDLCFSGAFGQTSQSYRSEAAHERYYGKGKFTPGGLYVKDA